MADSNPWKAQMLNKNKNNTEQNKSHETVILIIARPPQVTNHLGSKVITQIPLLQSPGQKNNRLLEQPTLIQIHLLGLNQVTIQL